MADTIQAYPVTCPTGTTTTSLTKMDKYDQLLIYIPKVTGAFTSAVVAVTIKGAPISTQTPQQLNYYDYIGKTPASCVITVSTGGIYEIPYPGAVQYVQAQFDTPVSNVTNIYFMGPKTTY